MGFKNNKTLDTKGFGKLKFIVGLAVTACAVAVGVPITTQLMGTADDNQAQELTLGSVDESLPIALADARATKCEVCGQTHTKAEPKDGATYPTDNSGDYIYTYHTNNHGWSVRARKQTNKTYKKISSVIDTYPVVDMTHCFDECANMATAPEIPDTVWDLTAAFANCTSLIIPPDIPLGVVNMNNTFHNCTTLTSMGNIPESVLYMNWTFRNCKLLYGDINVNANVHEYADCFANTEQKIVLVGASMKRVDLALTDNPEIDNVTAFDGNDYPTDPKDPYPEKLEISEYIYTYDPSLDGYVVSLNLAVTNRNKTSYSKILESIGGKPIMSVTGLFKSCRNMTESPVIPDTVIDMSYTYQSCYSLLNPPVLPSKLINMESTFNYCEKMTKAPIIPYGVQNCDSTFRSCKAMTTYVGSQETDTYFLQYNIPDTVIDVDFMFYGNPMKYGPKLPPNITTMISTFMSCNYLIESPVIPNGVTDLKMCYVSCWAMKYPPVLPDSVIEIEGTFASSGVIVSPDFPPNLQNMKFAFQESALQTCKPIPASVTNMMQTFQHCSSLTGTIEVYANIPNKWDNYGECFNGAHAGIKLVGPNQAVLKRLAGTGGGNEVTYEVVQ